MFKSNNSLVNLEPSIKIFLSSKCSIISIRSLRWTFKRRFAMEYSFFALNALFSWRNSSAIVKTSWKRGWSRPIEPAKGSSVTIFHRPLITDYLNPKLNCFPIYVFCRKSVLIHIYMSFCWKSVLISIYRSLWRKLVLISIYREYILLTISPDSYIYVIFVENQSWFL